MEFGQTPKQIFTHPHPERKLPRIMQDRLWSQNCYVEAKDGIQSEQASGGTLVNRHRKLSLEQRVFLLQNWWKCDKKYATVKKMFIEKYPAAEPPTRQAIYKLNKRFEETGAVVDLPRSGRPRTAVTDDNVRKVAEAFLANPGKSIRKASAEFGIARSSYQRILDKL
ncbi:uncharacterized protein LOC111614724 isoform X1 [Centruroides sculpturatus]|nr:uncharacterized protein LOC111614724 isoform X1 [Centruroides sculpturatus]